MKFPVRERLYINIVPKICSAGTEVDPKVPIGNIHIACPAACKAA